MRQQTDPHMALYNMRLRAMQYGTRPVSLTTTPTSITEHMSDGSTIELSLDPNTMEWTLVRFFHEQGQKVVLYRENGEYVEEPEEEYSW